MELTGLTGERNEMRAKIQKVSQQIQTVQSEQDERESSLSSDEQALLERLQVKWIQFLYMIHVREVLWLKTVAKC